LRSALSRLVTASLNITAKLLHEQAAEILGLSIYMGGGPWLMYVAGTLGPFDQFAQPQT